MRNAGSVIVSFALEVVVTVVVVVVPVVVVVVTVVVVVVTVVVEVTMVEDIKAEAIRVEEVIMVAEVITINLSKLETLKKAIEDMIIVVLTEISMILLVLFQNQHPLQKDGVVARIL